MRLCTFEVHTHLGWQSRLGAVDGDGVIDLNFAAAQVIWETMRLADALVPPSLRGLLEGGDVSMEEARQAIASLPAEMRTSKRDETLRYRMG